MTPSGRNTGAETSIFNSGYLPNSVAAMQPNGKKYNAFKDPALNRGGHAEEFRERMNRPVDEVAPWDEATISAAEDYADQHRALGLPSFDEFEWRRVANGYDETCGIRYDVDWALTVWDALWGDAPEISRSHEAALYKREHRGQMIVLDLKVKRARKYWDELIPVIEFTHTDNDPLYAPTFADVNAANLAAQGKVACDECKEEIRGEVTRAQSENHGSEPSPAAPVVLPQDLQDPRDVTPAGVTSPASAIERDPVTLEPERSIDPVTEMNEALRYAVEHWSEQDARKLPGKYQIYQAPGKPSGAGDIPDVGPYWIFKHAEKADRVVVGMLDLKTKEPAYVARKEEIRAYMAKCEAGVKPKAEKPSGPASAPAQTAPVTVAEHVATPAAEKPVAGGKVAVSTGPMFCPSDYPADWKRPAWLDLVNIGSDQQPRMVEGL